MKHFILSSILLLAAVNVCAQDVAVKKCVYGGTRVPILPRVFKIKAVLGVSSGDARVADYVEFKTMDPIYSAAIQPKVLFAKDTPIYGLVTRRKHRHFPMVGGKLELRLEPLVNWDGEELQLAIARHGPIRPGPESDKERKARNNPAKNLTITASREDVTLQQRP